MNKPTKPKHLTRALTCRNLNPSISSQISPETKRSSFNFPSTKSQIKRISLKPEENSSVSHVSSTKHSLNRMSTFISTDNIPSITFRRSLNQPFDPSLFSKFVDKFLFNYKMNQALTGDYSISEFQEQYDEIYRILQKVEAPSLYKIKLKSIFLPVIPGKEGKKTIIFDLDETLVHICDMSSASQINLKIWVSFVDSMNYGVLLRPYAMQCLHKAKDLFEVVLFTASEEKYAQAIIDYLDPDRCIFDHCFFKQACINVNGFWVKDLRIFMNRQLKNVIIVDNFMPSYLFQLENGIPVTTWTGEFYDKKLLHVIEMMDVLSQVPDVREVIRKTYGLRGEFSGIRF